MAFTEFYCDAAAGSNVNAGDKTANGIVTSTNGAWSSATNIFVATGGTPFSGVTAGDFCSLMLDGGTVAVYTARVTNVGSGGLTLTLSSSAFSGSVPSNAANGVTATTGGAWKGPNGAVQFPFNYITAALADATGHPPRVNLKNNATYNITAGLTPNKASITYQGYTSSAGDGGFATIDGGTSGASYILFDTSSGSFGSCQINYVIFQNNGATGNADGFNFANNNGSLGAYKCVVHDVRGNGFKSPSSAGAIMECEAYNCNQSATSNFGGFNVGSGGQVVSCISHDNTGVGFLASNGAFGSGNIADSNTSNGFEWLDNFVYGADNCEAYNNGGAGFLMRTTGGYSYSVAFRNCNMLKNGTYAIDTGNGYTIGVMLNCGIGSGTQANASGVLSSATSPLQEIGTVTYASNVTPWVDPANGDFRINLTAAKGTGRGTFTQTASSYAGTIGYPDIGAAQHQDSGGGGTVYVEVNQVNIAASPRGSVAY